jgi:hypothetical protein
VQPRIESGRERQPRHTPSIEKQQPLELAVHTFSLPAISPSFMPSLCRTGS